MWDATVGCVGRDMRGVWGAKAQRNEQGAWDTTGGHVGWDGWGVWDGMSGACGMGQWGVWDVSRATAGPFKVHRHWYLGCDGGHGVRGATSADNEIKNVAMSEWYRRKGGGLESGSRQSEVLLDGLAYRHVQVA